MRLFLDPWPWVDYLRAFEAAFGSRIHGSIAAVLAGTPVVVLAHDSRTLELARYFDIPHRPLREVAADVDPAALLQEADFAPLTAGHLARWERFAGYLGAHGLDDAFAHPGAAESFDAKVASTPYPPAVASPAPGPGGPPLSIRSRVDAAIFRTRRTLNRGSLHRLRLAALHAGSNADRRNTVSSES